MPPFENKPAPGMTGPAPGMPRKNGMEGRVHKIELTDLIVHKYSEADALFKKADKVAQGIITNELRGDEAMRCTRPGSYRLIFPKLTPEAGALRCAVIAEQVAREVRKLNPTSQAIDQRRADAEGPQKLDRKRTIARMPSSTPAKGPDAEAVAHEQAMRDAANRALAAMITDKGVEELNYTEAEKKTLQELNVLFHPVWHTKNNLITAYNCSPSRDGRDLRGRDLVEMLGSNTDAANAKIDATVYSRAVKAMQVLMGQGLKAVLIVPIHFSTVDRLRYLTSLLEAGVGLPQDAKNLMVFELLDLPSAMSRFRLREPVSYLRTRARALIARTGFDLGELEQFKEFGFHGISVNCGDYDWSEGQFLKNFEKFVESAERLKLQSFVHGISSKSLAVGAISSGFTYMDGAAISEPVDNPSRIRPFEIDMLYES